MVSDAFGDNFSRSEFACKCGCGFDTVDVELINALRDLRVAIGGKPITITSGCRCESHNKAVGGAPNSQHLYARAADIYSSETTPSDILEKLEELFPNKYGIGIYSGWVHIDTRNEKARWGQ